MTRHREFSTASSARVSCSGHLVDLQAGWLRSELESGGLMLLNRRHDCGGLCV
jgi:hypothetical protein